MKIGYLSSGFGRHSVSWLARWTWGLLAENEAVEQHFFSIVHIRPHDQLLGAIAGCGTVHHLADKTAEQVTDAIAYEDVDLLIDLDSCTSDVAINVLMNRPCAVQASWLGWDAPAVGIDYVIGDPIVTPPHLDHLYAPAKVLRLPRTHIAVAGFERSVNHYRCSRHSLGIPRHAVLFLCAGNPPKVSQDYMDAVCQILQNRDDAIILVRHADKNESYRNSWYRAFEQHDIEPWRLLLMPRSENEDEWRANMQIADCLLDTFPYSGCTTVIEALSLDIPVHTLAGRGYHARTGFSAEYNSYVDGGGFANTSIEEWVENASINAWGRDMRRDRFYPAPLWDVEQFAADFLALLEGIT